MYTLCRIPFKITLLIDCVNSKMILSTKLIFDRPLYTFIDFKIIFINNFFLIYSLWSEFWVQVSNLEIIRQKYIFLHSIIISIHGIYPMWVLFFKAWNYDLHLMDLMVIESHSTESLTANKVWLTISLATEQWKPKAQA